MTFTGLLQWLTWIVSQPMWVGLITNAGTPSLRTMYSDLDIATFDGADPQPLTFGTPKVKGCRAEVPGVPLVFAAGSGFSGGPITAYGYVVLNDDAGSPGTDALQVVRFSVPVVFTNPGDTAVAAPVFEQHAECCGCQ